MANVHETSHDVWISEAVRTTEDWPLVDNPKFIVITMISYLLCIQFFKNYMKDRKPLQIRNLMIVHNFTLVALSTYIFGALFYLYAKSKHPTWLSYCCEMPNQHSPIHHAQAVAMWWYYISKMFDLLDTAYLIAKKRPVSVLHAYHHTTVLFLGWVLIRYLPSGASVVGPMANSFVHMIMYTYYGLAAIGPHMQKYLWWKKYLTKLQMIQFIFICSFTFVGAVSKGCNYPPAWLYLQIFYVISLFALFANFYYQTYVNKKKTYANNDVVHVHSDVTNGSVAMNGVVGNGRVKKE